MKTERSQIFAAMLFCILATSMTGCEDSAQAIVNIENFTYQPAFINVTAGTTVTWVNHDPVDHTVTADDGSFDSGIIAGDGGMFNFTFSEPGAYEYHCSLHPSMTGEVFVVGA